MALVLPDVVLVNTINMLLRIVREDYAKQQAAGREHRSILSLLFKNVNIGTYNVLDNIKQVVLTDKSSPVHIEAQLSYDHNVQSTAPIIWVTLPSENNRNNSLGVGMGNQDAINLAEDGGQDQFQDQYNYRFATTYQIVIGAINKNELTVLYHLLKSLLIASIGHLDKEGISNLKIGGGDIRLGFTPERFYTKAITLNFEYEHTVPDLEAQKIFRKLRLYYKPEGATTRTGPIEIEVDDNINSDFDSES